MARSRPNKLNKINLFTLTVLRNTKLLRKGQQARLPVELNLPGVHNVSNALAAIGVAQELGLEDRAVLRALKNFQGVGRRLQRYGDITLARGCKVTVMDDYGHHPVEMRVTLDALRGAYPGRRLLLAFQPHRYSRTRDLFDNFVEVLCTADELLLAERFAEAEQLYRELCLGLEVLLGPAHPDVAEARHKLAAALGGQGKTDEAVAHEQNAQILKAALQQ